MDVFDEVVNRPSDLVDDATKSLRLFKGLSEVKNRVDIVVTEDSKSPDLYDQLINQSEPQNYFFEPYASQWSPQLVKKGALIPLPRIISSSLENVKSMTLSGLLSGLPYAWTSIDTQIVLWNYKVRGEFLVQEFSQAVVAVGLCMTPVSGVFTKKVNHILVVATTTEIVLLAVLIDPHTNALKLQPTKMSVSTDGCIVSKIVTSANGRIFFGGSDGNIYEVVYHPHGEQSQLPLSLFVGPSLCYKTMLTSSYGAYLPKFILSLGSSPNVVVDIVVDDERCILYVLHENTDVTVFDLGFNSIVGTCTLNEVRRVCTLNLRSGGAMYAREYRRTRVSCPDERIFLSNPTNSAGSSSGASSAGAGSNSSISFQVISLEVVPRSESSLLTLVAISSTGIRCYLSVFSRRTYGSSGISTSIPRASRPTRLEILCIRLPPPALTINDAPPYHAKEGMQPGFSLNKSPSSVHLVLHRLGVCLMVEGAKNQEDALISFAHDPIKNSRFTSANPSVHTRPAIRESVSLDSCVGKVVALLELEHSQKELDYSQSSAGQTGASASASGAKRSYEDMRSGFSKGINMSDDKIAKVDEVTRQYSEPSRHFVVLSNAGIQVWKKIRPLDQLHRALVLARGDGGGNQHTSVNLKALLGPFLRGFGDVQVCCMLIALACGVQSDPLTLETSSLRHRTNIKADDYIYITALQGIFECAQQPASVDIDTSYRKHATQSQSASDNSSSATSASNTPTRIVLSTDIGMSCQHDGLVMFLSRVLRPLWYSKTIGIRIVTKPQSQSTPASDTSNVFGFMTRSSKKLMHSPSVISYRIRHSKEHLNTVREILFQCRQVMETAGPFAMSISNGAVLARNILDIDEDRASQSRIFGLAQRFAISQSEEQKKREVQIKTEQSSLYFLYQLTIRAIESISLLRLVMDNGEITEELSKLPFSDLVTTSDGVITAKAQIKSLMSGANETNESLMIQLRDQCPNFFTVKDVWQYQGHKLLSMAKLSSSINERQEHLQASLNEFLQYCHMWNTDDCVSVLTRICEEYGELHYYEGIVKLSLACSLSCQKNSTTDLNLGVEKNNWKRKCVGCILLALKRLLDIESKANQNPQHSPQAVDDMVRIDEETRDNYIKEILHHSLASDDEEFHEILYAWLLEQGHTHLLTSIRSPYIEAFLKDKSFDGLIQFYMTEKRYLDAAKVWWLKAHEDLDDLGLEQNPDLLRRQYYVSKALACVKGMEGRSEFASAVQEIRDVLDVLQLQMRVLNSLEQSTLELESHGQSTDSTPILNFDSALRERRFDIKRLNYQLFDASLLYNQFAKKYEMWSVCLYIIQSCKSEDSDEIKSLWEKIIYSSIPLASSHHSKYNQWLTEQRARAGLTASSNSSLVGNTFESGLWIGQLQCKLLRLGKSLFFKTDDTHMGSIPTHLSNTVFPISFLARELEKLASLYSSVTDIMLSSQEYGSISDISRFQWVVKIFLDIGVSTRMVLECYEDLLHDDRGTLTWTIHVVQAIYTVMLLWRQSALNAKDPQTLSEFAKSCPHLVELSDELITELVSLSTEQSQQQKYATLLKQIRQLKDDLLRMHRF